MKKHEINTVVTDINGKMRGDFKIEAEIYEYKGLQFGIYWPVRCKIQAIHLQTGYLLAEVKRDGTKSPRKDLLQLIADFVDNTDYEAALSDVRDSIELERRKIDAQIHELEQQRDSLAFPINERIEL